MNPPEMKVDSNYEEKLNCINATMITHVVASSISLAPAFYKSQSALMPLLLQIATATLGCNLVLGAGLKISPSILFRYYK